MCNIGGIAHNGSHGNKLPDHLRRCYHAYTQAREIVRSENLGETYLILSHMDNAVHREMFLEPNDVEMGL